jgi:hypothetical protein
LDAWICFDAGTGSDAGIFSEARICSKAVSGVKAGIGSDAGTLRNNSLENHTKTMYAVMIDNITTPLITIFYLFF